MKRKILTPVRGDVKVGDVLGHAVVLARRFNTHIEPQLRKALGWPYQIYRGSSEDPDFDNELGVGLTISGGNF